MTSEENSDMLQRYKAAMLLSGVGDAMGYRGGQWEFCFVGQDIHREAAALGGVMKLKIKLPDWPVSDDTVLHIASAKALLTDKPIGDKLYIEFAAAFRKGKLDMSGRAPGATTMSSISSHRLDKPDGYIIPFNKRGGGCGGAMRSMCIGLRFHRPDQLQDLIAVSIESARMTHNSPTGYLGSMAAALFTSFAVQNVTIRDWGRRLVQTLPQAWDYVERTGRDIDQNKANWSYFTEKWQGYLKERKIDGEGDGVWFPDEYGVAERDAFYKSLSFAGWGGASGHDAPMIAYDALLGGRDNWEELCLRGMLHSGDNDSTGVMAGCWFGALYGMKDVPECNYKGLEYGNLLQELGEKLYHLSHKKDGN